jgi:predicted  nucleic acid-binding Zn-ribbon protein
MMIIADVHDFLSGRQLNSEFDELRQQVTQLNSAVRAKDREVEKVRKLLTSFQVQLQEEEQRKQSAERKCLLIEAEVAALRSKVIVTSERY